MKSYNGVAILSRLPFLAKDPQNWCDKGDSRHGRVVLPAAISICRISTCRPAATFPTRRRT